MVLVVLAFVVLTGAAMLDAYGPCVGRAGAGKAFGCFIGLLVFFSLVSMLSNTMRASQERRQCTGLYMHSHGTLLQDAIPPWQGQWLAALHTAPVSMSVVLLQVIMLLWSYFAAFLTEPGKVPAGWSPFASDEVRCHAQLHVLPTRCFAVVSATCCAGILASNQHGKTPEGMGCPVSGMLIGTRACRLRSRQCVCG